MILYKVGQICRNAETQSLKSNVAAGENRISCVHYDGSVAIIRLLQPFLCKKEINGGSELWWAGSSIAESYHLS